MNEYDDNRDREFDDRPPRPRNTAMARAKIAAPGLILIILGLFGIVLGLGMVALVNNLSAISKMMKSVEEKQPAGPEKDRLQAQITQIEEADTPEVRTANTMIYGGATFVSFLILIGGWKARSLSGYPIALAGAFLAVIPFNGCGCITTPFGIWAVIMLLNSDVRAAFGQAGRSAPEDY